MQSHIENWLKNNHFTLLDNNGAISSGRNNIVAFFNKVILPKYVPGCFCYVQIIEKNIEFEDEDLRGLNHTLTFAFVAVCHNDFDELIDLFMVNLGPNIIRISQDYDETNEVQCDFLELEQEYYKEVGTSGIVA